MYMSSIHSLPTKNLFVFLPSLENLNDDDGPPPRKVKVAHYNYSCSCSRSDSDDSVEGYILPLLMLLLVVSALLESLVVT